jgi:hypothetical protein
MSRHANLPFHLYVKVNNKHLGAEADIKYAKIFDLYGIKVFQISKYSLLNIENVMKQEVENIKKLSLDLEY